MNDLDRIIAEMREWRSGRDNAPPPCVTDWADRLAALAGAAPVAWEYRHGNSEWQRVEPRIGGTVADRVGEIRDYIAGGYRYELRPLFTHAPAKAREDDAMEFVPAPGFHFERDGGVLRHVANGGDE